MEEWTGVEWAAERQRGSEAAREADGGGGCADAAGTKKKRKEEGTVRSEKKKSVTSTRGSRSVAADAVRPGMMEDGGGGRTEG